MKLVLTPRQTFKLFQSGLLKEHEIKMSPASIEILRRYMKRVNKIK